MSDQVCGIYVIRHRRSGKCYVGQSVNINRRWEEHRKGCGHSPALSGAFKKYGLDSFQFEVLEVCGRDQLNEREGFWVKQLNSMSPNGYNLTTGGGQPSVVAETRQKLSASLRNSERAKKAREDLFQREDWKQAVGRANRRKSLDSEWKEKNQKHLSGMWQDPERKEVLTQVVTANLKKALTDPVSRKKLKHHLKRLNSDPELLNRRREAIKASPAMQAHLQRLNERRRAA